MAERFPQPKKEKIKIPEDSIDVPNELLEVSESEVLQVAEKAWNPIMREMRKERGFKTWKNWTSINLPLLGEPGRVYPLTSLATIGCTHAFSGGCTMCDYGFAEKVNKKELFARLNREVDEVFNHIDNAHIGYETGFYNINAIGSFFDDAEITSEIRKKIFQKIAERKNNFKLMEFITESRLEFINEEKLKEMRAIIGNDVDVEVGFGIESMNRLIREGVINKHLPDDYKEKIALLRKYNVKVAGHIIIKPPLLTEGEAIEDAVNGIREMFSNNLADIGIIMTMNKKPATLIGKLIEEGKYKLPSIWTTVEIMKRIGPELALKCGFFGFSVADEKNVEITNGCNQCRDEIFERLINYSPNNDAYNNLMQAADKMDCPCKRNWQKEVVAKPKSTLVQRIAGELDLLIKEYLGRDKKFQDYL